jgi:hypothetical protein
MVMNSFGKRNFMQPMGKAQSMHSRCLGFFPFKFGGWGRGKGEGRRDFKKKFPCSQCVPAMFPLSSQWVRMRFPICSSTCSP